jgi:hypothetical protein
MRLIPAVAILVASLAAAGVTGVAAQDPTSTPGQSCVGTWLLRVTGLGKPASSGFPVTATFGADGTFIASSPPVSPGPADAPDKVSFTSTAQGVWEATDPGECAITHVFYSTDAQGNLTTLEIRLLMTLGPDGNTMAGTDYATATAPDGTVLFSGPGNTVEGTRLAVKLAPPASSPSPAP